MTAVLSGCFGRVGLYEAEAGTPVPDAPACGFAFAAFEDPAVRLRRMSALSACPSAVIAHPSAKISPDAKVGTGTYVGACAVIGPGAVVSAGCVIGPGAVVGHGCFIGEGCIVGSGVALEPDTVLSSGCVTACRLADSSGTPARCSDNYSFYDAM